MGFGGAIYFYLDLSNLFQNRLNFLKIIYFSNNFALKGLFLYYHSPRYLGIIKHVNEYQIEGFPNFILLTFNLTFGKSFIFPISKKNCFFIIPEIMNGEEGYIYIEFYYK